MALGVDVAQMRWVPTAIARRMLGVSRQRVYQLVTEGKLASQEIDGVIMISVQSIKDRQTGQRRMLDYGSG